MSYEEEIEDLEYRLLMYKGVTGGHPARAILLSEKIKSVEKQLDILKRAEAFDAIMREWEDERLSKSHILETIQKYYDEYESGE